MAIQQKLDAIKFLKLLLQGGIQQIYNQILAIKIIINFFLHGLQSRGNNDLMQCVNRHEIPSMKSSPIATFFECSFSAFLIL